MYIHNLDTLFKNRSSQIDKNKCFFSIYKVLTSFHKTNIHEQHLNRIPCSRIDICGMIMWYNKPWQRSSSYRQSCRWRFWGNLCWGIFLSAATHQRKASSQWSPPDCSDRTTQTHVFPETEDALNQKDTAYLLFKVHTKNVTYIVSKSYIQGIICIYFFQHFTKVIRCSYSNDTIFRHTLLILPGLGRVHQSICKAFSLAWDRDKYRRSWSNTSRWRMKRRA